MIFKIRFKSLSTEINIASAIFMAEPEIRRLPLDKLVFHYLFLLCGQILSTSQIRLNDSCAVHSELLMLLMIKFAISCKLI